MHADELLVHARQAIVLSVILSFPVLAIGAITGFVVGTIQAATRIQEPLLAHLAKLVAVSVTLAILAPWMGREIVSFAHELFVAAG